MRIQRGLHGINVALTLVPMLVVLIFIQRYSLNAPRVDHAWNGILFAVAAENNDLTFTGLFRSHYGHLFVLPNLQVIVMTWLSDWNVILESYLTFALALGCYALLVTLAWRSLGKGVTMWLLLPFSMLVFALQFDMVWILGISSQWFYPVLLMLIAALVLWCYPGRWAIGVAAVCALLATLSNGTGITTWVVLGGILLGSGRSWLTVGVWGGLMLAALGLYVWLADITVSVGPDEGSGITTSNVSLSEFSDVTAFFMGVLGNTFASGQLRTDLAVTIGGAGLLLLAGCVVMLSIKRVWVFHRLWLPMAAYSTGSAFVMAATRKDTYHLGLGAVMINWYKAVSFLYWIVVVVALVLVLWHWRGITRWVMAIFPTIMLVLFVQSNIHAMQDDTFPFRQINESCYIYYLFMQQNQPSDPACADQPPMGFTNELALYRLSLFAQRTPVSILPSDYRPGQPVVLEASSGWQAYNIHDWLLHDSGPVLSYAPDYPWARRERLPLLTDFSTELDVDLLEQIDSRLGADHDVIWHVAPADSTSYFPDAWQQLRQGRAVRRYQINVADGVVLEVAAYERPSS